MQSPPILFLTFNRPDETARVFASIREARPSQLFIASDGPRPARPGEEAACQQVRSIAQKVDWECELFTLFRDENLGCQTAVSRAITWFFDHVEAGIILEDDCLPDPSFYRFCAELLPRFASDSRIGCITGDNLQWGRRRGTASYYFSKQFHGWGWATWRRAWSLFDFDMATLPAANDQEVIQNFHCTHREAEMWLRIFTAVRQGRINSWGYRWLHNLWRHRMLTVTPQVNLVQNIGFGPNATHTLASADSVPRAKAIEFPLTHATEVEPRVDADLFVSRAVLELGPLATAKRAVSKLRRIALGNRRVPS